MDLNLIGTSFSALDQIKQTRRKSRKRLWTIAFSLATLLALYQSASIATTYIQASMNVIETQVIDDENPSVTVCDNSYLPYMHDTDIYGDAIEIEDKLVEKLSVGECDPLKPTLFCLSLLNERERFKLGFQIRKVFSHSYYQPFGYNIIETTFNNLYYGNCAIFSTKSGHNKLGSGKKFNFMFTKPVNHTSIMIIHKNGTLPVFNRENIVYLDDENFQAIYSITKIKLDHEQWPFKSECDVFDDENNNNYLNAPDLKGFQFKYSYENCLDQCDYELNKKYCNCIRPMSMLEVNTQRLPICTQWCNKIPAEDLDRMCNCKPPCQDVKFSFKLQFVPTDKSSILVEEIFQNVDPLIEFSKNRSLTIEDFLEKLPKKEISTIRRMWKDEIQVTIYNHRSATMSEASAISMIEVLSAVGGIWGLWIGVSVSVLISVPSTIPGKRSKNTKARNILRKICLLMWYLALIVIAGIAGWQIYITISDFYKYKVIQISTTEEADPSTFPSLFLCSETQVHLSPAAFNNKDLSDVVEFFNHTRYLKSDVEVQDQKLHFYYGVMTQAKKLLALPSLDDLISSCQYQLLGTAMINCTLTYKAAALAKSYRACVMISPPTNQNVQIQEMHLRLQFPPDEIRKYVSLNTNSFHPFSFLSVLQTSNRASLAYISVKPGEFVDVKYNVKQIRRMKSPYVTNCVDQTSNYTFWPSNTRDNLPSEGLLYNYEDCLKLCALYLNEEKEMPGYHKTNIIPNFTSCECYQPCKENIYDYQVTQSKHIYKENFMLKKFKNYSDFVSFLTSGYAVVSIRRKSSRMKVITEKALIEDESLIGLIGGILGLWIGASILSLLVELQAIGASCLTKCKRICKR